MLNLNVCKNLSLTTLLAGVAFSVGAANALADEQPWLVRVRALNMAPANESDPVGGVGASDRIHVSNKTFPELDISYFFTPNLAAELVLTYPQKHDVTLDGKNIGSFKHLPPVLSLQYHFLPARAVNPYLGVGVNYTRISNVDLLGGSGSLESSSVGFSMQAGADIKVADNVYLNFDVKKVQIRSDVNAGGKKISEVKVDPLLVSIGLGWRF